MAPKKGVKRKTEEEKAEPEQPQAEAQEAPQEQAKPQEEEKAGMQFQGNFRPCTRAGSAHF